MLLGCIADDFTGASDLANTLVRGGMATVQYVGVPDGAAPDAEAGVVALKTRSAPAGEAVRQSLAALGWLRAQGCRQFVFKYCSTFDSTLAGNIGPVAEALLDALGAPVAVVCPAFPAAGRLLFQGHLFVNGRLLSESGMERHPLTPMTDPDLRRWLGFQARGPVGLVTLDTVRRGAGALCDALAAEGAAGRRLVVVDAVADDDLRTIGAAAAGHALVTGGSGVALGVGALARSRDGRMLLLCPVLSSPMPHKRNADHRHHIPKMAFKVQNWPVYEAGPRRRGSLTLWIEDAALGDWQTTGPGGQARYTDAAIQTSLTLRTTFKLALRQTEGLSVCPRSYRCLA